MKNKRVIKVEVPKEIWDASMSIWNWRRDIMGAWMKSIQDVIKQVNDKNKIENYE
jgi:hypothetical protein